VHRGMRLEVYAFVLWHCLNIFRLLQSLLRMRFLLKSFLFVPVWFLCLPDRGDVREHVYWPIGDIQEDRGRRSLIAFTLELRELVVDAIRLRAAAAGRYGSILSGGS